MTTIPFGPRQDDRLIAKARELPKDLAPARDLWPGIAVRLGKEERRAPVHVFGWPMALAAGVAVAAVSALLTWGLLREPDPTAGGDTPAMTESALLPVNYGPNSALGAQQLAARDALLAEFRVRFAQLAPATREAVLRNLAIIQQAADEIDAALAADPASGLLNDLLVGTYQQELDLYSKVVTTRDGATRRT
jgi:hypothetical protein